MLSAVTGDGSTQSGSLSDEIVREDARRMLAAAPEVEVSLYKAELTAGSDGHGRCPVVRNGHHRPRTVVTAAGPAKVEAPRIDSRRVDDATGGRKRPSSRILALWCRKSPFSTVKLRTEVTRGASIPAAALAMVFKPVESAQSRRRAITGTHLVPLARVGARFENGVLAERGEQAA
uniref:hypothetical protein n=1 Tax=Kitasatospora fiedleri TaxID=2991545 RepID=UPI00249BA119|nr:hypothetical protein [Kitasatospora fiedleri]